MVVQSKYTHLDGFPEQNLRHAMINILYLRTDIRRQWYLNLIHWPIYDNSINGEGIVISIIDDGLDLRHNEFNVLEGHSYDYIGNDQDPLSLYTPHGTAAAGVAVGKKNNQGIMGVAYEAQVVGYRLLNYFTSADEQDAYMRDMNIVHIKSCSWGPYDDPHLVYPISTLGLYGLTNAIENGRNGLGTIFVWAAGNGGQYLNSCNNDGYANSMYSISVTAVSSRHEKVPYGEECPCIIVSAPSSGFGYNVYTTDVIGGNGYSSNDYTDSFGGTSAAAPLVSGVVALMLQANPNLNWRDVQEILLRTGRKNEPSNPNWIVNGAGINYNPVFGSGVVDAATAVEVSKTWISLPNRYTATNIIYPNENIPDLGQLSYTFNFNQNYICEHVEVIVDIDHQFRPDLLIKLISPYGTVSPLTITFPQPSSCK